MFCIYAILVSGVLAVCPASYKPAALQSTTITASIWSDSNVALSASESFLYYNYTLQSNFNGVPSVSIGVSQLEANRRSDLYFSLRSPANRSSQTTVGFVLALGNPDSWVSLRFSCLFTTRDDLQIGQFIGDVSGLIYSDGTNYTIATLLNKNLTSAMNQVFISGVRMLSNTTNSSISSPFDISAASVTTNQTHLIIVVSKNSVTSIDVVWMSYVRVSGQATDLLVVVNDLTNVGSPVQVNPNGVLRDITVGIVGLVGFRIDSTLNLQVRVTLNNNFTLTITKNPNANVYNLTYMIFENNPRLYCAGCPSGQIFQLGQCTLACSYNRIINNSLGYSTCSTCQIQKMFISNQNKTSCVCSDQYFNRNGTCIACDYSCATCFDSSTCLSCELAPSIGTMRSLRNGKCVCPILKYYDNTTGKDPICGKCNYSCLTCAGPAGCLTCGAGRALVQGQCVCTGGLVDDGKNQECVNNSNTTNTTATNTTTNATSTANTSGNTTTINPNTTTGNTTNNSTSTTPSATVNCPINQTAVNGSCQCQAPLLNVSGQCLRCQATQYFNGSTCLPCSNGVVSSDGNTCTCNQNFFFLNGVCQAPPLNQTWNGSAFVCRQGLVNISGVCSSCTGVSEIYNSTSQSCVCQSNFSRDPKLNGTCRSPGASELYNGTHFQCQQGTYYVGITCTACAANSTYNGSGCVCNAGFFPSANGSCQSCAANSTYNGNVCVCNAGLFNISGSCTTCPSNSNFNGSACSCNPGFSGAPPSTPCTRSISCPANSQLINSSCSCNDGFFMSQNNTCVSCDSSCLRCTGGGNQNCSSCRNPNSVLVSGYCNFNVCPPGYYLNQTMYMCFPCSQSCNTCINMSQCLLCNTGFNLLSNRTCQEVCGDGRRFVVQCDDNNTLDGDGCSSSCVIEPAWNCSGGSTTSKDVCVRQGQTTTMKTVLMERGRRHTRANILVNISLNYIPPSLQSNNCQMCWNIVRIQLLQADFIPSISIGFSQTPTDNMYSVYFNFGSEDTMSPFAFSASINPNFNEAYKGVDTSQVLTVYVDPNQIALT